MSMLGVRIKHLFRDSSFSEVLTGSIWALAAQVVATIFGFISSIIVVRIYGPEIVGIVAIIWSFLSMASIFTLLGTGTSILRLIPEHLVKYSPASAFKVYRKTQYMVIIISLVTGALFFYFAHFIADTFFSKPHLTFFFSLTAAFIVFNSLMILNTQAIRGLRLIKIFAFMQVLPQSSKLLLLLLMGAFLITKYVPVYALLGSFTFTALIGWMVMDIAFRKRIKPDDLIHTLSAREILSISLPMLMTAAMAFIIGETGVIMLGIFRTETEVGYYAIAVKLATLTSFVLKSINTMAASKFSELFHSGQTEELFNVAKKSAKLIFWTTTPVLVCFIFLGEKILGLIYGQEFAVAYLALILFSLGQFVNSISGSSGLFLNMTGNQTILSKIMIITAIINVCSNLLLIPTMGINGAAIAGMVSMSFWNISALAYIKLKFGRTTGYFPLLMN